MTDLDFDVLEQEVSAEEAARIWLDDESDHPGVPGVMGGVRVETLGRIPTVEERLDELAGWGVLF